MIEIVTDKSYRVLSCIIPIDVLRCLFILGVYKNISKYFILNMWNPLNYIEAPTNSMKSQLYIYIYIIFSFLDIFLFIPIYTVILIIPDSVKDFEIKQCIIVAIIWIICYLLLCPFSIIKIYEYMIYIVDKYNNKIEEINDRAAVAIHNNLNPNLFYNKL